MVATSDIRGAGCEPCEGRGRGKQRGMTYPAAAPVLDSDTLVLDINCILTTTIQQQGNNCADRLRKPGQLCQ